MAGKRIDELEELGAADVTDAQQIAVAGGALVARRLGMGSLKTWIKAFLGDSATRSVGTSAGTVAAGDDGRLSDARTPSTHAASHAIDGPDSITPASIGALPVTARGADEGVAELVAGVLPVERIPVSLLGALRYQGTWNAATGTPALPAPAAGNKGYYYRVATAGTTNLSGEGDWGVGDWAVSNGAQWEKIDNSEIANDDLNTTALDPSNSNATVALRTVLSNLWTAISARALKTLGGLTTAERTTARANLDLGDAATRNVGTTAGMVAAGDDARIVNAAQKNENLTLTGTPISLTLNDPSAKSVVLSASAFPRLAINGPNGAVAQFVNVGNDFYIDAGDAGANGNIIFRTQSNVAEAEVVRFSSVGLAVKITAPHSALHSANSVALGSDDAFVSAVTLGYIHHACYYDTTSANVNQPLPNAAGLNGREYKFFKTVVGNSLTITPLASQGVATTLTTLDSCVVYRAFNSKWRRVSLVN